MDPALVPPESVILFSLSGSLRQQFDHSVKTSFNYLSVNLISQQVCIIREAFQQLQDLHLALVHDRVSINVCRLADLCLVLLSPLKRAGHEKDLFLGRRREPQSIQLDALRHIQAVGQEIVNIGILWLQTQTNGFRKLFRQFFSLQCIGIEADQ